MSHVPSLSVFDPNLIPYQMDVIREVRTFDYSQGMLEVLLSGSVGSAKSLLMAHLVITHCLLFPKAVALIGRKSLPDLKKTLLDLILEHLEEEPWFDRNRDYNKTTGEVTIYHNKSKIICHSWGDGNFKKVRSYAISMAALEEITENDQDEFYKEIAMRIGRASHVPEKLLISATNPDGPSHWAYKRLILSKNPCTKVFYSLTEQNPFLPPGYAARIRETLSKEEAMRMLEGQWIDIKREVIYYAFTQANVVEKYKVDPTYPIGMTWDFNIAAGKPLSMAYYQRINGIFIFFAEVVIHTGRTEDVLEEGYARDLIRPEWFYEIDGDASGKHGDTRNNVHDYDIIQDYLRRKLVRHKLVVPTFNPGVRDRHIKVNGQLCNANNKRQVYVVEDCEYLIDGFSQSKLKKGSQYIEDDSDAFQHITTAVGYAIHRIVSAEISKSGVTVKRMR